jgi:hypothetical protein
MKFKALLIMAALPFVLTACGNAKEDEARRLGFSDATDMESAQSKGWHTNAQYTADETERAHRFGFTSIDEMHRADDAGVKTKAAYDKYVVDLDIKNEEFAKEESAKEAKSDSADADVPAVAASSDGGSSVFGSLMETVGLSEAKNVVVSSCEGLESGTGDTSMRQMTQVFGQDKVKEWCDCTYNTMSKKYSDNDLANAPNAGALNDTATAIKRDIYLTTATCIDRSSVPSKGVGLKKDFAGILRATVGMSDALKR